MKKDDIDKCAPERLAELMAIASEADDHCGPAELAALLRRQLSIPVPFDMGGLGERETDALETLCHDEGLVLKSLGDLFSHPRPPVALLELTKRYAKACRQAPDSPIPEEIALVLYYASVGVALVKCHKRITDLDDASLKRGIESLLDLPWLEPSVRRPLKLTLTALTIEEAEP